MDAGFVRYSNYINNSVREGAIFLMHPSILNFGTANNKHYSICADEIKFERNYYNFNPCTSKYHHKDVFAFQMNIESTCATRNDETTYVLLSLRRKVRIQDIIKTNLCEFKGVLLADTLSKYKKAKKEYVLQNRLRRNKH